MTVENTCDCGNVVETEKDDKGEYDVCYVECPECGSTAGGGNCRTGKISGWITPQQIARSNAEYQRQLFSADMNEWEGRGNHAF